MKILVLVTDAFGGHGGIAKFNRDLLSALCQQSDVERVVALPRLLAESSGTLPPKLDYVTRGVGGKFRYALAVLKSAISNQQSEVILCGHINLLPVAFLARLFCRAPIVLVIHGIDAWQPTRSWLVNKLVRRVDGFIAVSEFTRRKFLAWAGVASGVSFILPNCVDLWQFTPGPKNEALLDRYDLRGKKVLLTVARLSAQERYKGIDEVLEVLPELAKGIPELAYLIVGDGTDRTRLEEKVATLGLRGRVKFAGWISHSETVQHHRLADAFVMPGRGEGFGIVYLEAMACGVPVVASKADASGEVVRGCAGAVLANPDKPEEIKTAIRTALQAGRDATLTHAKQFSREHFQSHCGEILAAIRSQLCVPEKKSVLVFRIGQLGDTIVALPAMWAAKKHFPKAKFTLLCDRHPGKPRVLAADLLRGAGLFERFKSYVVAESASARAWQMAVLWLRLRRRRFNALVYLAPSTRTTAQVARDRKFFSAAGVSKFYGMNGFVELPIKVSGEPLAVTAAESDLLLKRLAADGIDIPAPGKGSLSLLLGAAEQTEVDFWLTNKEGDGGRVWLGIGPGSKMPAKRWPEDRFREVVMRLIAERDVWPVVFGGPEDAAMAQRLIAAWGRGYNAAGGLSLRGAAAALKRCRLYLGNDTGTMHLAATACVPCVAVFSSREWPGMWFPYGVPQKVFRSQIECEGCALMECVEKQNECLLRIQTSEVFAACEMLLKKS